MTQKEQIEIQLSKKKIRLSLFLSIMIVVSGILALINPSYFVSGILFGNQIVIFISGLAYVLFFGLCAIVFFRKLSDKKAGLIINEQGIIDNSSGGVSAGLVLWSNIEKIIVYKIFCQKFLIIFIKNPQEYIAKVKNLLKRKTMETNYKMTGSPISISDNILQTNFDNLHNLFVEKKKEYQI